MAANAALQVFPAGHARTLGYDLATWNREDTWKGTYGPHAGDLVCFARDLVGVQFAIDRHDQVIVFEPETAARTHLGSALHEWATWLQAGPDYRTVGPLAAAWQDHLPTRRRQSYQAQVGASSHWLDGGNDPLSRFVGDRT